MLMLQRHEGAPRITRRIVRRARLLRHNATDAEKAPWRMLRGRLLGGAKFRRQHPIAPFVADFACPGAKLIVEADGGQHADRAADEKRTAWLQAQGWRVRRFARGLTACRLCCRATPHPTLSPEVDP